MMTRSSMLGRSLLLVLITVLLTALLTLAFYQAASPYAFAQIKGEELLPKARLLADSTVLLAQGEVSQRSYIRLLGNNSTQWDASVWLVNAEGKTLLSTYTIGGHASSVGDLPAALPDMVEQVLAGEEVVHSGQLSAFTAVESKPAEEGQERPYDDLGNLALSPSETPPQQPQDQPPSQGDQDSSDTNMVVVGVPIITNGVLYGAIFMAQPMTEVVAGMRSLTNILLISAAVAALLMLPVVVIVARSLSRPMRRMRDVALTMANGDFDVRADEGMRGEIGELGGALNYLSGELSATISELTVERNRLRSTLNGLSEGIVAIDATGHITHANPAVYSLFGTKPVEDAPQRDDVIPDPKVWALYDQVLTEGAHDVTDLEEEDGRIVRLSLSPLEDEDQRTTGAVGIFRDITEAERLEQTRRDYVANVSHELRTPLTALRALIEPLRDGLVRDDAARDRAYTVMLRETLRLSRLVNDMLELSRLQSGTISLAKSPFDVQRVLRETVTKYHQTAEDMGQQLLLSLPEDPLPMVYGNSDRTEQVLVSLLDNAMKYTPDGGTITLSAKLVNGGVLHIIVADTGVGIAPEDLPNVFERFYKADKAHQTKGTGLGLAITREILRQLGEEIWVESRPGEGATFTFTLHTVQAPGVAAPVDSIVPM